MMLLFLPITYDQPDLVVALYYDAPSDSLRSCGGRRVTRTRRPMLAS
jgi:hypothetical protein